MLVYRYYTVDIGKVSEDQAIAHKLSELSQGSARAAASTAAKTIYFHLTYGAQGVFFQESEDCIFQKSNALRTKTPIKKARRANVKVRLPAEDLNPQLRDIE